MNSFQLLFLVWMLEKLANGLEVSSIVKDHEKARRRAYHMCLIENEIAMTPFRSVSSQLVTARRSSIVRLHCVRCSWPVAIAVEWSFRRWGEKEFVPLKPSTTRYVGKGYLMKKDFSLFIINIESTEGGEYFCNEKQSKIVLSMYFVEVVKRQPVTTVLPEVGSEQSQFRPTVFPDLDVLATLEWSSWSACNRCQLGERRRYGYCRLKPLSKTSEISDPTVKKIFELLPGGIPCHSMWAPTKLRTKEVAGRANVILSDLCEIPCPTEAPERVVTEMKSDGKIRVLENIKKGFYSLFENKPPLPPSLIRRSYIVVEGNPISIFCPRDGEEIYWQRDDSFIPSAVLAEMTGGRAYFDEEQNLIFASTRRSDSGFYSCWRYDGLVLLSANLHVSDPNNLNAIKTAIIAGGCAVLLTFTCLMSWSYLTASVPRTTAI